MKDQRLSRYPVVFALLAAGFAAHAAPVRYEISPLMGASSQLTGFVMVDDANSDHAVEMIEIVGWGFTATGSIEFNSASTLSFAFVFDSVTYSVNEVVFNIVGTTLAVANGVVPEFLSGVDHLDPFGNYVSETWEVFFDDGSAPEVRWSHTVYCYDASSRDCSIYAGGGDAFTVLVDRVSLGHGETGLSSGHAGTASEPGSLALLGVAGAVLAWSQRRRRTAIFTQ